MATQSAQREAWRRAREQHSVITHRQLRELGFTPSAIRHRLSAGRLFPIWSGIYVVGRRELSQRGLFMAAVLACGAGAVLSHMSAALLWGIVKGSWPLEVSVQYPRAPRRRGIRVHRRGSIASTCHRQIPVTTPTQTLLDLGHRLGAESYERAVNEAVNRDLVDPEQLRVTLDTLSPQPGIKPLRTLLDRDTYHVTESELEQRVLPIARRVGLGKIQTQASLNGRRVDFYFPQHRLVLEANSLRYHRTASQQANDARRAQEHAAAGLLPIPFTHWQITHDPDYVDQTLRDAVRAHRV